MEENVLTNEEYKAFIEKSIKQIVDVRIGRMKRADYFMIYLIFYGLTRILDSAEKYVYFPYIEYVLVLSSLIPFYLLICAVTKRFRDVGLSGWFAVLYFLIQFSIIASMGIMEDPRFGLLGVFLVMSPLFFWPSQKLDNKYGKYTEYSVFAGIKKKKKS